jgi:hypothetical protein
MGQFNQSIPLLQRPKFSEGTALSSKRDDRNNSFLWKKGELNTGQIDSFGLALQKLSREVAKMRRRIVGGGTMDSGWDWQYPDHKELDPTLWYSAGKWAYISALNPLVVTGMKDLVSNATVTSCQGIWLAMQDVPAASGGKWNVPTLNYPSGAQAVGGAVVAPGTTAPSGTPLMGDLDLMDATTGRPVRFWEYFGDIT